MCPWMPQDSFFNWTIDVWGIHFFPHYTPSIPNLSLDISTYRDVWANNFGALDYLTKNPFGVT
jgi:hypothetical protein